MKKAKFNFEDIDLSRWYILTYDELLNVNGGSGNDSGDDDSEDAEDSLGSGEPETGDSQTATETTADSGAGAPTGDEPEEEDFHVTSHAEVANMEPGETITRSDGSEYTVNQGDIDYEQNYCNEHGIDWQNDGKEEDAPASGNLPTEEESGKADSASSTAEVGGSHKVDNMDEAVTHIEIVDSKEPVGTEEHKTNVENDGEAKNSSDKNSETASNGGLVTAEDNKNSTNESSLPISSGHGEKSGGGFWGGVSGWFDSLADKFNDARSWVSNTFTETKNWVCDKLGNDGQSKYGVVNETGVTILIKPESSKDPYSLLKTGEHYHGKIDGVIFPDGTVVKTNGAANYIAKTDTNGNYVVFGGEKADSYLNSAKECKNEVKEAIDSLGAKVGIDTSFMREEDLYSTYNYAIGSQDFLTSWLNIEKGLDIDNNRTKDTTFVPIPLNLDGSVPTQYETISRWNEFLK